MYEVLEGRFYCIGARHRLSRVRSSPAFCSLIYFGKPQIMIGGSSTLLCIFFRNPLWAGPHPKLAHSALHSCLDMGQADKEADSPLCDADILPELDMGILMYVILGSATAIKIVLWFYCVALQHRSDSMLALAEDHRNDILSNSMAIACGIGASASRKVWWIDPAGAIVISFYIVWSWLLICKAQVLAPATSPEKHHVALCTIRV